ncbi:MAG: aminotransferase [Candidatus Marinimicrobia bacterium]|nr:aminotransferase [Candidatus Neomarinimicrobiota bacterium]|tara:strand:+ start:7340 stop:8422 length:1083 start_codon:yes stop_codon:yes gene_type:complete
MPADRPKLFIPGPTHVDDKILEAMGEYPIGHRTAAFSDLYDTVVSGVQKVLFTSNRIFLCTCSATGLWEAAVRNTVLKRCANFVAGAFSKRWHEVTVSCGIKADPFEVELGQPITAEFIDKTLSTGEYDAVTVVHNETSTGVMSPLHQIAEVMHRYPDVAFLVDMVSSMSAVEVNIDDLRIDVALASVQKGWSIPPGFSLCSVSDLALNRSYKSKNKGYYFDFQVLEKYALRSQTPATPSIPHLYGLHQQLNRIFQEGLDNRFRRHNEMAERVRSWAKEKFSLFPDEQFSSTTLTCVEKSPDLDIKRFQTRLLEKGYLISRGYGTLKERTFRVSHMGDLQMSDIEELLSVMDETVEDFRL